MLLKIAILLIAASLLCRWAVGKWPWQLARRTSPQEARLADARRLLGVSQRADRTEILAAHKLVLTRVHPDRGGSPGAVHAANDARDQLLAALGEPAALKGSDGAGHDADGPSKD